MLVLLASFMKRKWFHFYFSFPVCSLSSFVIPTNDDIIYTTLTFLRHWSFNRLHSGYWSIHSSQCLNMSLIICSLLLGSAIDNNCIQSTYCAVFMQCLYSHKAVNKRLLIQLQLFFPPQEVILMTTIFSVNFKEIVFVSMWVPMLFVFLDLVIYFHFLVIEKSGN